jgi:hypothetical protein
VITPGKEWGAPCDAQPDLEVHGGDTDLASAVAQHPGTLIRFTPNADSDIARAVGLRAGDPQRNWAVPMDVLRIDDEKLEGRIAVNMAILGTPPDEANWRSHTLSIDVDGTTTPGFCAVVATGQYRNGLDLVPRSHPGDGWAELQLYNLPARHRAAMKDRLATGSHLPHPNITQRRIHTTTLTTPTPLQFDLDGLRLDPVQSVSITVVSNAYRLLL